MWFLLWLLLSVFVFGVFAWSYKTLLRQKKAWKEFAQKNNLTYHTGKNFLDSPAVTGAIGDYGLNLFSTRMPAEDGRTSRFNMVMEFSLHRGIPTFGAIYTPQAQILIEGLEMPYNAMVDNDPNWDPSWKIRAQNTQIVLAYLTPERRTLLAKLFRMKIISALLAFNNEDMILRLETADPLDNIDRVEKIIRGVVGQLDALRTDQAEFTHLQRFQT
jgi:hypothetical protein